MITTKARRSSPLVDSLILIRRSVRHMVRSTDALLISFVLPVFQLLLFVYVFGGAIATGPIRRDRGCDPGTPPGLTCSSIV